MKNHVQNALKTLIPFIELCEKLSNEKASIDPSGDNTNIAYTHLSILLNNGIISVNDFIELKLTDHLINIILNRNIANHTLVKHITDNIIYICEHVSPEKIELICQRVTFDLPQLTKICKMIKNHKCIGIYDTYHLLHNDNYNMSEFFQLLNLYEFNPSEYIRLCNLRIHGKGKTLLVSKLINSCKIIDGKLINEDINNIGNVIDNIVSFIRSNAYDIDVIEELYSLLKTEDLKDYFLKYAYVPSAGVKNKHVYSDGNIVLSREYPYIPIKLSSYLNGEYLLCKIPSTFTSKTPNAIKKNIKNVGIKKCKDISVQLNEFLLDRKRAIIRENDNLVDLCKTYNLNYLDLKINNIFEFSCDLVNKLDDKNLIQYIDNLSACIDNYGILDEITLHNDRYSMTSILSNITRLAVCGHIEINTFVYYVKNVMFKYNDFDTVKYFSSKIIPSNIYDVVVANRHSLTEDAWANIKSLNDDVALILYDVLVNKNYKSLITNNMEYGYSLYEEFKFEIYDIFVKDKMYIEYPNFLDRLSKKIGIFSVDSCDNLQKNIIISGINDCGVNKRYIGITLESIMDSTCEDDVKIIVGCKVGNMKQIFDLIDDRYCTPQLIPLKDSYKAKVKLCVKNAMKFIELNREKITIMNNS